MTAPVWLASPPEVHSALLSSGPGPAPMLASANEWSSLSVAYAEVANELSALLGGVEAGAWEGSSAVAYTGAHGPYLAWLLQASADSAAIAAEQETAAGAYITALAAMPTLAELAANHTTHAVLTATNFFGINTIPIALTEADYVRMWIQAATVMAAYQGVSTTAIASAPKTGPAPQIMKADAPQNSAAQAATSIHDPINQFLHWLWQLYTEFYNNVIQPFVDWLANLPFFQAMFSGFNPYLVILGNPLTYLSPANIAFALGYPMDIGTYVALLSQTFAFIAADLAAAFASGNPVTIGFTIMFVTVEAIGTVITDTIALLKTLLEQTLLVVLPAVVSLLASAAPLAAGAVLAPIAVKGLVALAAAPAPPPPPTPPLAALAPSVPTSAPAPSSAPVEATVASTSAPPAPPTATPPTVTGSGVSAHLDAFGYLMGDLSSAAKRAGAAGARNKTPEPDEAEEPAAATAPQKQQAQRRRRRTKVQKLGRGYEYADLDDVLPDTVSGSQSLAGVAASDQSARTLGFAGVAPSDSAAPASGLITLAGDAFDKPRAPMVPSTWEADSALRDDLSGRADRREDGP